MNWTLLSNVFRLAGTSASIILASLLEMTGMGNIGRYEDAYTIETNADFPSFSMNGFMIGSEKSLNRPSVLEHEYGHILQERLYQDEYLGRVAIPSAMLNVISMALLDPSLFESYKSFPWEKEATELGREVAHGR